MINHESFSDALTRMADGLERQASTIPSIMRGHTSKLLQDSAYLRKAARIVAEKEDQKQGN